MYARSFYWPLLWQQFQICRKWHVSLTRPPPCRRQRNHRAVDVHTRRGRGAVPNPLSSSQQSRPAPLCVYSLGHFYHGWRFAHPPPQGSLRPLPLLWRPLQPLQPLTSSPPAQFPHLETVRSTGSSGPQPWERARSPLSVGTDPRDPCGWCPVAAPSRPAEKRPGCTRRRRPSPFTHPRAASLFPVWGRSK